MAGVHDSAGVAFGRLPPGRLTAVLLAVLLFATAARAEEEGAGRSPLSGRGLAGRAPYTAEELAELEELASTVKQFEEQAAEYREATRRLIERKYQEKRDQLYGSYEGLIVKLENEQRSRREAAIAKFEEFLRRYPDDPRYAPDAMFRLSELYFERSYDECFQARQAYDKALEAWKPSSGAQEPVEPAFHYEPTIAMMQRLITEFPDYRLLDGAYYLLGYCLGEQGEEERAVDVYLELVERFAEGRFTAEVWTRIGEYYFATNELQLALAAYTKVLGHPESPFYDKAMYKLAWTHYRLADPERAPQEFQHAVDTFVELLEFNERTKSEGKERGGELRRESIQYLAISYADESWGSLDKMIAYLDAKPNRPYEREAITALGDVYFDQTRFHDAIRAYEIVQHRFPDHVEAPQVQEKVVTAHERNRDFEASAVARRVLSKTYSEGSPWYVQHKDEENAIREARELVRKSLYSAALFHHRQAQIHKEAEKLDLATTEYGKAADAYGEYLQRFPHDRQLYELTFYYAESLYYSLQFAAAAPAYAQVRDAQEDDKFREAAAYSVILSHEKTVQIAEANGTIEKVAVLKSADRPDGPIEPREIPPLKLQIVAAADRYLEVQPDNEKVPKILFKAAEIFYTYDHLEEARRRFQRVLDGYPKHEVAEYASNLIIESYLAEKQFAAVEAFSRELLARPAVPGRKEFKDDLVKFKTGAMFKLAEDLDARGEAEQAAEMYIKLIDENPATQFADSAMNNAAVNYEKAKRYDSASKLYERLVNEHPESPLADTALFRVGLNAERFFDFEKAIKAYLRLVNDYPKSERRADAIYNAALSLENTQEYHEAVAQYLRYCKLFQAREDAPEVCFRAGDVYAKMGDRHRVAASYQDYIKKYKHNKIYADRITHAYLKIAQAHEGLGQEKEARKAYALAVGHFRVNANEKSAPYAAEAQFQLVEREFADFRKIVIAGDGKKQQKLLVKKAEALKEVEGSYQAILKFKQIEWTLASLFRIGQLYQSFAESIIQAPCPPDVRRQARSVGMTPDEVCDEYRIMLEEKGINVEDKAVIAYETTINKARELQVANQWTKNTLVALNKLRRASWPLQKDAKLFVDTAVIAPPALVDALGAAVSAPAGREEGARDEAPAPADEPASVPEPAPVPESEQPQLAPVPAPLVPTPIAPSMPVASEPATGGQPPAAGRQPAPAPPAVRQASAIEPAPGALPPPPPPPPPPPSGN